MRLLFQILVLISVLFHGLLYSQEKAGEDKNVKPIENTEKEVKVSNFFKDKTEIPDVLSLRDPFKLQVKRSSIDPVGRKRVTGVIRGGVFTNKDVRQEDIGLNSLVIKGVFLGEKRSALATFIGGKGSFLIKEGMKLGRNEAEVKAILPGGIVVVEKITNIYDQEEYLETIIPISE